MFGWGVRGLQRVFLFLVYVVLSRLWACTKISDFLGLWVGLESRWGVGGGVQGRGEIRCFISRFGNFRFAWVGNFRILGFSGSVLSLRG